MTTPPPYDSQFTYPSHLQLPAAPMVPSTTSRPPAAAIVAMAGIGLLASITAVNEVADLIARADSAVTTIGFVIVTVLRWTVICGGTVAVVVFIWRGARAAVVLAQALLGSVVLIVVFKLWNEGWRLVFSESQDIVEVHAWDDIVYPSVVLGLALTVVAALALPRTQRWVRECGVIRARARMQRRGQPLPPPAQY